MGRRAVFSAWRMVPGSMSLAQEMSLSLMVVRMSPPPSVVVDLVWCGRRDSNPHHELGVLASSPLNDDHMMSVGLPRLWPRRHDSTMSRWRTIGTAPPTGLRDAQSGPAGCAQKVLRLTSARRACRYWQYSVVPAATPYGVVSRAGTRPRRSSTGLCP